MAYVSMSKPTQGTATKKSQIDQIIDNDEFLNDALNQATGGIVNGSFETGTGTDAPVGWDRTTWGTAAYDIATPGHGAQAYSFTSTGAGGGKLTSTDFIAVSEYVLVILSFLLKSSVADILNIVKAKFYDKAQSAISDTTLYTDATTNPTSWTRFITACIPPATARYMKLELTFADSSDATAGTCYFDGLELIDSLTAIISPFTLSEQTTDQTSWIDTGSFTVNLGGRGSTSVLALRFIAQLKRTTGVGIASYQRFRVGTTYSSQQTTVSGTYVDMYHELTLPGGTSGVITIYQQLYTDNPGAGNVAAGQKVAPEITVEILTP